MDLIVPLKPYQTRRIAEIISQIADLAERARVAQFIGLVISEASSQFNWDEWNELCNINN